ncbi:hypothetical protein AN480_17460 [Mycobacterium intracellulare subsp. chimaera]|uniref:hypothetical protein n=1 Tax=Mycobacterium intracellulare TaxID=1767 RepID=UPI00090AB48C|nr:hypothetical protein [Mycobacterium intracellulare]AOS92832.2 hypothetical protein AN480_17460 [Mycobacterium intracellulare subsp. chimaera]
MRLVPISGYTDCNGRRVPPYVQRRRAAAPRLGQQDALRAAQVIDGRRSGGQQDALRAKGVIDGRRSGWGVLVAGWALWQAAGQVREFTGDRLENPAPLAGSSWFATAGVVCEATGRFEAVGALPTRRRSAPSSRER